MVRELTTTSEGRLIAVRLEYTGRCAVHNQLAKDAARQQLTTNIRALAAEFGDDIWVEKIRFHTQSPLDLDAMRERQDLLGQLLRDVSARVADPSELSNLSEVLDLASKTAAELTSISDGAEAFELNDPVRQAAWLSDAEALLLSHLVPGSGEAQ